MNEMKAFNNSEFGNVRTVLINGEPYFVGKDVATALGYTDITHTILDRVDEEDRINSKTQGQNDPEFGQRGTWLINESGLYSLILSSKLPSAKKFKKWVTSEVLPSIRKTGSYSVEQKALSDKEILSKALLIVNEELHTLKKENEVLTIDNKRMKPKEVFSDAIRTTNDDILIASLAKILKGNGVDIGQNRLYEWLRNRGYLVKRGTDKNLPTQKAINAGLFKIREKAAVIHFGYSRLNRTAMVTPKGQLYFVNKFLAEKNNAN